MVHNCRHYLACYSIVSNYSSVAYRPRVEPGRPIDREITNKKLMLSYEEEEEEEEGLQLKQFAWRQTGCNRQPCVFQ